MRSTTFAVHVDTSVRKRLERLAKSTGHGRSFLAAQAINEYLEFNEWRVAGIERAIASTDRGKGIPHNLVKDWVASWGSANERSVPRAHQSGRRKPFADLETSFAVPIHSAGFRAPDRIDIVGTDPGECAFRRIAPDQP